LCGRPLAPKKKTVALEKHCVWFLRESCCIIYLRLKFFLTFNRQPFYVEKLILPSKIRPRWDAALITGNAVFPQTWLQQALMAFLFLNLGSSEKYNSNRLF
jgi:hypothetical protein